LGGGGMLGSFGATSLSHDQFVLVGGGMPNAPALYFQGTGVIFGGAGGVFGDGLRCVAGIVIRLGIKHNVGNQSHYPETGDPAVHVRGLIAVPGLRHYQVWYRNAASFCTASTFNLTNGLSVTWLP
jgi:hypothetical protein